MKKQLLGFALGIMATSGYVALAQGGPEPAKKDEQADIAFRIKMGELQQQLLAAGGKDDGKEKYDLGTEYAKLGSDLEAQKIQLGVAVNGFYWDRSGARGAVQVSQVADEAQIRLRAIEIAQNRRMIQLLEQLVNRK